MQSIDNMDNPSEIYKQSNRNYLIITEVEDKNGNTVIVPIKMMVKELITMCILMKTKY